VHTKNRSMMSQALPGGLKTNREHYCAMSLTGSFDQFSSLDEGKTHCSSRKMHEMKERMLTSCRSSYTYCHETAIKQYSYTLQMGITKLS
jgi:hypothetical protein